MAEQKAKAVPKPQHKTASPYSPSQAHQVERPHRDVILERLLSVLAPVKEYRAQLVVSKGKNSKKRKRDIAVPDPQPATAAGYDQKQPAPLPTQPLIASNLLIGFNRVIRHLEELSTLSAPKSRPPQPAETGTETESSKSARRHVAAVFLLRPLDDLIYSHLPTLCHTASLAHAACPATRLALLDPKTEKRVADAVGLPRVSVLAVMEGEDGVSAELAELVQYVRERVEPVDVPWLRQATEGRWMGTRVETQ